VKRPSGTEVASVKSAKWTKLVVSNSLATPGVSQGVVGASSSKAPMVTTKKSSTSVKGRRIQPTSMLEVASSVESHESSPHNLSWFMTMI
jgi:hypothetical protein